LRRKKIIFGKDVIFEAIQPHTVFLSIPTLLWLRRKEEVPQKQNSASKQHNRRRVVPTVVG
jgi:hypothetical protein